MAPFDVDDEEMRQTTPSLFFAKEASLIKMFLKLTNFDKMYYHKTLIY